MWLWGMYLLKLAAAEVHLQGTLRCFGDGLIDTPPEDLL